EERVHVTLLGPTDIPDGIVDPVFLILRVVPSWAVRTRESQRKLLRIHVAARHSQADVADDNHATAITKQGGGHFSRLGGTGCGGEQGGIHTVSGEFLDLRL